MLAFLDETEGDPDLEAYLTGYSGGGNDDREGDGCDDEDGGDDEEHEASGIADLDGLMEQCSQMFDHSRARVLV